MNDASDSAGGLDRRSLLAFGAASLTPQWLTRWFGEVQDPAGGAKSSAREQQVRAAFDRARKTGRPLLVFVAPEPAPDEKARLPAQQRGLAPPRPAEPRGLWFAAFLVHGGAAARFEAALGVPVCARASELKAMFGLQLKGEPAMLWVDPSGETLRVAALKVELGPFPDPGTYHQQNEAREHAAHEQVTRKSAEIVEASARARESIELTVERLAAARRAHLSNYDRARLDSVLDGRRVDDVDLLVEAAPILVDRIRGGRPTDDHLGEKLDAAVLVKIQTRALPGSVWWVESGCAARSIDVEGNGVHEGYPCGMGYVPPLGRRFLDFYLTPAK